MMAMYILLTNTGMRTVMRGSATPHTIVKEESAIWAEIPKRVWMIYC